MNKYLLLIAVSFSFLVLIPITLASITAEINVKNSFGLGERVFYNYTIISDNDITVVISPFIECPSAPVAPMMEKTINITKNVPYNGVYYGIVVEDTFETQTCAAYVRFITPTQEILRKNFTIVTNPGFSFDIMTCKDKGCSEISKIFLKNGNIYLDYDSEIENTSITAVLTYPDKTTRNIFLPASIKAEQVGTYTLNVRAGKEGYRSVEKTVQFGVIEKQAEIKTYSGVGTNYRLLVLVVAVVAISSFAFLYLRWNISRANPPNV